jgi:hypothetical protein
VPLGNLIEKKKKTPEAELFGQGGWFSRTPWTPPGYGPGRCHEVYKFPNALGGMRMLRNRGTSQSICCGWFARGKGAIICQDGSEDYCAFITII